MLLVIITEELNEYTIFLIPQQLHLKKKNWQKKNKEKKQCVKKLLSSL